MNRSFSWLLLALVVAGSAAGCATTAESRARTPLERELRDHPQDRAVNVALAQSAERAGDWLRAEQYYRRAEALGAPDIELMASLLRVLVAARRYDEALARCQERLEATPDDRATRYVAAALLVALDRPREATHELSWLARRKPDDPEPYLALARIYRDANDRARADAMLARYVALAPQSRTATAAKQELARPDDDSLPDVELPPPPPATTAEVPR